MTPEPGKKKDRTLYHQKYHTEHREKRNAASDAYRKANPEYFAAKKREERKRNNADPERGAHAAQVRRAYYLKNRERIIAHQNSYAARNRDKLKAYRQRNSERRVATARTWQNANKERYVKTQTEWRAANRHIIRKHIALRRARLVNATIGDPRQIAAWEKEWKSRLTNTCEWCRMETPTELCESDHAQPLILGGAHNLDNLVISCKPCNNRKRGKPLSKWLDLLEAG